MAIALAYGKRDVVVTSPLMDAFRHVLRRRRCTYNAAPRPFLAGVKTCTVAFLQAIRRLVPPVEHSIKLSGASMKKWISNVTIGAALAAVSSASIAMDGNFFVNGEVAGSDINISNLADRNDTSTAGALRVGYMWNQGPVSWGLETGYVDLGNASGNDPLGGVYIGNGAIDPLHVSVKTHGEMLGGNFKLHFSGYGWFLSSRLGWFRSETTMHINDGLGIYAPVSDSASGDGLYAGIGAGYDFNRHIGISLNYDVFQTRANGIFLGHFNTNMYGGTFEYRF
jgi:hypothetical protein